MNAQLWKRHAIRKMRRSRKATLGLLSRLPRARILQPGTQGRWSVKDTLAHIIAWEEVACRRLFLIRKGKADRILFYDNIRQADRFNARAVKRLRPLSFAALLTKAAMVRQDLIAELKHLPSHLIDNPLHRYSVSEWLPEFAWTHEASHLYRIRKLL